MADLSRFDDLLARAKEKKKPKPDIKQVYREFVEYREQAAAPEPPKNQESEKPEKVGQPEEDFLK